MSRRARNREAVGRQTSDATQPLASHLRLRRTPARHPPTSNTMSAKRSRSALPRSRFYSKREGGQERTHRSACTWPAFLDTPIFSCGAAQSRCGRTIAASARQISRESRRAPTVSSTSSVDNDLSRLTSSRVHHCTGWNDLHRRTKIVSIRMGHSAHFACQCTSHIGLPSESGHAPKSKIGRCLRRLIIGHAQAAHVAA